MKNSTQHPPANPHKGHRNRLRSEFIASGGRDFSDIRILELLLFYCIPIKIKYLAFLDAALFVVAVITTSFPLNLLPVVAVLNFFIFCGGQLWSKRPRRSSKNTVNFRRESQRIRRQQEQKLYNHKCAVCGRTDTDFPELEFRYCSRCQGYHCFCQDHINNHIHFTE